MIHLYGIPNCDTVKKSLVWLKNKKQEIQFHDFKQEGVTKAQLKKWAHAVGLEKLLNKKSTTWRELSLEQQTSASTEKGALNLMQEKPSVIKRPVVEWPNGFICLGFEEAVFLKNVK